jgi:hypothetical protein
MGMLYAPASEWAEEVHVMQSTPAASAVIADRSSEFLVRFNRPVALDRHCWGRATPVARLFMFWTAGLLRAK